MSAALATPSKYIGNPLIFAIPDNPGHRFRTTPDRDSGALQTFICGAVYRPMGGGFRVNMDTKIDAFLSRFV